MNVLCGDDITDMKKTPDQHSGNVHAMHRKRVKDRFLTEGIDGFQAHNVLELLLFYSIPQRDTNETAHALMNKFGSLSAVFDAPFEELLTVDGISEHSATLIKMVPALSRRYETDKSMETVSFGGTDDVGRYLVSRYIGITVETVLLLLLDNSSRLIECVKIHEGSVNSAHITNRKLVETALIKHAASVILAHNHPGGIAFPSAEDLATTRGAKSAFDIVGIPMTAHIIVAGNSYINILES